MTENKDEAKEGVVEFAKVRWTMGGFGRIWIMEDTDLVSLPGSWEKGELENVVYRINTALTALIKEKYVEKKSVENCKIYKEEISRLKREYEKLKEFPVIANGLVIYKLNEEIARLKKENEKILMEYNNVDNDLEILRDISHDQCREIERLKAENERLRDAGNNMEEKINASKKLTMGPSLALQDRIMMDNFDAVRQWQKSKEGE